jgi:hypothetical protein
VRVISRKATRDFGKQHADSVPPIKPGSSCEADIAGVILQNAAYAQE